MSLERSTQESHSDAPALSIAAGKLDMLGGVVLIGFAAWLWFGANDIESTSDALVGPATFPRVVALLLGLSAFLLVCQGAFPRLFALAANRTVTIQHPVRVFIALALLIVYPILIGRLSFYPATAIFLPPLLWVSGLRNPLGIAACTVGFLGFAKLLFEMVLGTPLP